MNNSLPYKATKKLMAGGGGGVVWGLESKTCPTIIGQNYFRQANKLK